MRDIPVPEIVKLMGSRRRRRVEVVDLTEDGEFLRQRCTKLSRTHSNTQICSESYSFSAKMAHQLISVMDGVLADNAQNIEALHQALDVQHTHIVAINAAPFEELTAPARNTITARM